MSLIEGSVASARVRPAEEYVWARVRSAFVLALSFLVFFPLFPSMPAAGLDPSWRMALNEAWARGFDFAQAMVFTYGPYAFLSTGQYQPNTYPVYLICALFLGTVLFLLLRNIELGSKGTRRVFVILLCLIASGCTRAPDVRFLCCAFLLLVAAAEVPRAGVGDGVRPPLLRTPVVLNFASFSLGLVCLVKGTYAVEIGAMGILSMIALYTAGRRLLAPAILLSFVLGLVLFWLIAGQPLGDLPRFFIEQAWVAVGYGSAMGAGGSVLPPALFILSSAPLAIAIRRDLQPPTVRKYTVVIGMAITLFLGFKEGFVREDEWHVMIAAEILFILPWCWHSDRADVWRRVQASMAGLTVLVFVVMYPAVLDLQQKAAGVGQFLHCFDLGPIDCPLRPRRLNQVYDLSLARIRAQEPLPEVQGTVDVYTADQYLAIANGYRWDPRPVGQSYSVYSPALARLNAEHLVGATAPDGVLFALDTIDGRLPTLADGPSWPILLSEYSAQWLASPARRYGGLAIAYLKHKSDWSRIAVTEHRLLETTAGLGSRVDLPASDDVLFAEIDIRPNLYGRLEDVLLRGSELYIDFLFPGGRVERYRFIPGMARAGFVISPVMTNASQFVALGDLKVRRALSTRRPIAFWLSGPPSARLMWTHAAVIQIRELGERSP
ncbi:MAG TPA: hypothetical protein VFX20_00495 [Steroidobacteraceae bacterium]|nr:hypothetical protein [Steroidobacteraceae bacterium]